MTIVRRPRSLFLLPTCLLASALFLAPALPAQTASESPSSHPRSEEAKPAAVGEYTMAVFNGAVQVATFTLKDLQGLRQIEVQTPQAKKPQQGPTLPAVLEAAGIKEFQAVTIDGFTRGRISTAELTLKKDQVTDKVVFDLTKRGTAKLASPEIPYEDWIIDVSRLVIK